ncbi:histone deacetylase [Desulfobulbus sp.]|uniref:histone deacetylase family protein n=1 Tax=Desulfobulbus sp. TaxID=895 RepID=UPI00286F89B6|nr:histone deacetylase [Desulfobulbus sp.]
MDSDSPITIITASEFLRHDTGGSDHPEAPERMLAITDRLAEGYLANRIHHLPPRPAEREQLMAFHTEDWLFRFEESVLSGRTYIDHPDNQVGYDSYEIATLSAGSGLVGVDLAEAEPGGIVFCQTRPPGHHAEPNQPYGFCFFNNCVIAARYWQRQYGRRRVCVFDFDAHHGNGIQTAFEEEADTSYISIHEHPSFSYPGTGWAEERGIGAGKGTILNLPLPPGAGEEQVLRVLPKIRQFLQEIRPDALIVGAGFDAHRDDDMSGLAFTVELYRKLGVFVREIAEEFTQNRVVSILEGGYNLRRLGSCVEAYLLGLAERDA